MTEDASPRSLRRAHMVSGPIPLDEHETIGEEALHFTRWFMKSKYHLMASFLGEITHAPRDVDRLKGRFARTLQHGHRVHQARGVVTLILALGVVAAATSAAADALGVGAPTGLLERAAALSASASVLLVVVRLLLDRYLERCDVAATFLAMEIAASRSA